MSKILLVEDDDSTADYISNGLSEAGFVVDRVDNGRDGLFQATDGGYDCIVLDRMLPGLDGMAALAAIRAAGVTTPVLILSAMSTPEDRVAGLTSGSDDYLTKPFVFAELLARVRLLVRRRVAERWASVEALAMHGAAEHQKAFGRSLRLHSPQEMSVDAWDGTHWRKLI